jgi:hypothetical protein
VRLSVLEGVDLPLVEQFVRAYYAEDGHTFHDDRQPAALAALAAGDPFGRAWLIRLGEHAVGYVVLTWTFSIEAGGREACIDELYLVTGGSQSRARPPCPDVARSGSARSAYGGCSSRSSATIGWSACIAAPATSITIGS